MIGTPNEYQKQMLAIHAKAEALPEGRTIVLPPSGHNWYMMATEDVHDLPDGFVAVTAEELAEYTP